MKKWLYANGGRKQPNPVLRILKNLYRCDTVQKEGVSHGNLEGRNRL
nr:MAG TPA: hypothetical protein [Caudoviricetes sp.]